MNNNETHTPSTEIADNCGSMRTKSGQGIEIIGSPVWNGIGEPGSVLSFECESQRQAIDRLCMKVFGARPVYPELPEPALPSYRGLPSDRPSHAPKDFADTGNPITAWAFYEAFERKHCSNGWLRAQMSKMEHDLATALEALTELLKHKPREDWEGWTIAERLAWETAEDTLAAIDWQQIKEGDF